MFYDVIDSKEPIYLKDHAIDWNHNDFYHRLTEGDLSSTIVNFRISPNNLSRTIREYESINIESSLYNFYQWYNKQQLDISNPFSSIPIDEDISVYGDYLRFKEIFSTDNIPKFGNWNNLFNRNINNFNEENATLWIGTKGSHTPMHYDTYGKNVIIQIKGKKKWKLWKQNDNIPILRLPFEESSIYTEYDPKLNSSSSSSSLSLEPDYEFILNEGDVLFVPKHVWHFVEIYESDIACSINVYHHHHHHYNYYYYYYYYYDRYGYQKKMTIMINYQRHYHYLYSGH